MRCSRTRRRRGRRDGVDHHPRPLPHTTRSRSTGHSQSADVASDRKPAVELAQGSTDSACGLWKRPAERIIVEQVHLELARLATSAAPVADRAQDMLRSLHRLVPFDAAWIAGSDRSGYRSLASMGLDPRVVRFLSGPKMAHDIEATGTNRPRPPLSPSDLPYPAEELATWAECLVPADIHEALAVALFEPGGRHVGFLALLSGDRRPPKPSSRRRLAEVAGLVAQAIDPMRSLAAMSRLVGDAFAGVLLFEDGSIESLPGLPGDDLLAARSGLLTTVGARVISGETHLSFLWPRDRAAPHEYVRVSYLTGIGAALPDLLGIVLLSSVQTVHRLTARELEVLGMIVDGSSNEVIAHRLVVTTRTVAAHVEHILAKLSSPTRTHAAVRAQREGIYVPVADGAGAG